MSNTVGFLIFIAGFTLYVYGVLYPLSVLVNNWFIKHGKITIKLPKE